MSVLFALAGLFVVAFGAATILPFPSEPAFLAALADGRAGILAILVVASVGNTLGSVVNYALGLGIERFSHRRWFPASPARLERARAWYTRWGVWSLLFSWAPLGDAVTVIAGVMRTPFWLFLGLVAIAKTGRYVVLAWAADAMFGG